jgi:hypothetical protein
MLSNHVTLINDNVGRVPPEALPQLEKLARLAGARFVLRELVHAPAARRGATVSLAMRWANVGVGKLHRRYVLRIALVNAEGQTAFLANGKADPRDWLPGQYELEESLAVPAHLPAGEYTLVVLGLEDAAGQRPPFRLAIEAPEKDGRYSVSRLRIE